jgi:hypothetical protein
VAAEVREISLRVEIVTPILGGATHARAVDEVDIIRAATVRGHLRFWWRALTRKAGAPKPTSRMVAPGAVYFFERADGRPFGKADARSLWSATIGSRTDDGLGRVVPGVRSTPPKSPVTGHQKGGHHDRT